MIILVTGLPGAGKTLYALNMVQDWAQREKRQVFFDGIADLRLPWSEHEGDKWFELPSKSIIVIDEAQRVFRPRHYAGAVPEHVAKLETHRHAGVDLVLITQHPKLLDANVRRLCGRHLHVVRKFGMQASTIHEWGEVNEDCEKARTDSIRHDFIYPAKSFGWYKSAEAHTHKRRIPARLFFLVLAPVALAGLGWSVVSYFNRLTEPDKVAAALPGQKQDNLSGASAPSGVGATGDYLASFKPRVSGLLYTAPRYDEVRKVAAAPFPAACIRDARRCRCYTEQGTVLDIPLDVCMDIVERGYFDDAQDKGAEGRPAAGKPGDKTPSKPGAESLHSPSTSSQS